MVKNNQKVDDELLKPIFDKVIEFGNSIYDMVMEDNAIQYDGIINTIFRFLSSTNHKEANNFEDKIKKLKLTMNNYIQKHGHSFSFEIPLDKLLQPFKDDKYSLQTKVLMLTHAKKEKGKGLESFYTQNGRCKGDPLTEMLGSSTPHDSYFTMMKQEVLNMADHIYLNILHYFISEERIVNFMSMLATIVKKNM